MKGRDLIRWIAYHDMWDADVVVSYLHRKSDYKNVEMDEISVVSEITSVCQNGPSMQLNELDFDNMCKFRREHE